MYISKINIHLFIHTSYHTEFHPIPSINECDLGQQKG